jgi:ATP-dependent RNA helicase DHX37/DHR1
MPDLEQAGPSGITSVLTGFTASDGFSTMAPHPDAAERRAIFAAALLDGAVLPSFSLLRPALAAPSSLVARPETRAHRRASDLLAALAAADVDCRAALGARWASDPGFLRRELGGWLREGAGPALDKVWGALLREAGAGSSREDGDDGDVDDV